MTGTGRACGPFAPDAAGLQEDLVKALSKPDSVYLRAYRAAVEASDPTAEFLLHYAILGLIYCDTQAAIDGAIDPNHMMGRKLSPNSNKKPVMETSITRVRNELAHFKDRGLSLHEAAELAPEIREIVRVHIEKNL